MFKTDPAVCELLPCDPFPPERRRDAAAALKGSAPQDPLMLCQRAGGLVLAEGLNPGEGSPAKACWY